MISQARDSSLSERARAPAASGRVLQTYLDTGKNESRHRGFSLANAERHHIEFVLKRTKGRLGGKQVAATLMGIPRTTLQYRLKKHGIDPKGFAAG